MKEHFLTLLRDRGTAMAPFREAARELARLLAAEASLFLPLQTTHIDTPLAPAAGKRLSQPAVLIPILRAGLALLPAFQELLPEAPIGFFGMRRDEKTALPRLYYENLPPLSPNGWVLLLDPMLATGGSANLAFDRLKSLGQDLAKAILISIIAAPEGVRALKTRHPEVRLITGAVDMKLDAKKFIVPGLGDFGDRFFGTLQ